MLSCLMRDSCFSSSASVVTEFVFADADVILSGDDDVDEEARREGKRKTPRRKEERIAEVEEERVVSGSASMAELKPLEAKDRKNSFVDLLGRKMSKASVHPDAAKIAFGEVAPEVAAGEAEVESKKKKKKKKKGKEREREESDGEKRKERKKKKDKKERRDHSQNSDDVTMAEQVRDELPLPPGAGRHSADEILDSEKQKKKKKKKREKDRKRSDNLVVEPRAGVYNNPMAGVANFAWD